MKKLSASLMICLLTVLIFLLPGSDVVASTWCRSTALLADSVGDSIAEARCYRFDVASGSSFLRVKLEASGGAVDLYHKGRSATFMSNWDRLNTGEITGRVTYVLLEPSPGIHTIAVDPLGGTSSFRLEASTRGVASAASSQPSRQCSGTVCSSSYPLSTAQAVSLGSDFGDRVILPIEIGGPGPIEVRADWSGTANNLALILNGPDRPDLANPVAYYARQDGRSPLTLTYQVSPEDFRRGRKWRVSLVNFSGGEAAGNVEIDYPSGSSQFSPVASTRPQDFLGLWENIDPDTGGLTRIEIGRAGDMLGVHTWGACTPEDCDHGTTLVSFTDNPLVVERDFSFKQEILTLTLLQNGELRALSDNVFTDGSRRDYASEYYFRRVSGGEGTLPAGEPVSITFEALPSGEPITADMVLSGNEFQASGILLGAAPQGSYCAEAIAGIKTPGYGAPSNYLTTLYRNDTNMCNAVPVRIEFVQPVREVVLSFAGASVPYTLTAYDSQGNRLGAVQQEAVFHGGLFQVGYQAENIGRVEFGHQAAITAVTEVTYIPAGAGPPSREENGLAGVWENVDPNTRGITRVEISQQGDLLNVHTWGSCTPQDCDHGIVTAPLQDSPVVITRDASFKQETLILTLLDSGELQVVSINVFTDGTDRDYTAEYRFHRSGM